MAAVSRGFQVLVKPAGAACNLRCRYCYYLRKGHPGGEAGLPQMPEELLEAYVVQHMAASPDEVIRFSWHGGEPLLAGLEFFERMVAIQRRHRPAGRVIANGIQTNGILLDNGWGRFLAEERFSVGLSLDGPREIQDECRISRNGLSTFEATMRGYELLRRHGVATDILCVVGKHNVWRPAEVYGFFKEIGASYVTFLPLVIPQSDAPHGVNPLTVPAEAWGDFLCAIFDEWLAGDIGRIKVQIIEEAARSAFGLEHSLCLFRPVCGDIPVVDCNGDFYSCDHFVNPEHRLGNLRETSLADLIESREQRAFGLAKRDRLPRVCRVCPVLDMCHGECPKNRFTQAPDGEPGLNYLCPGYLKFFTHARPFVDEVAAEWRRQRSDDEER
ncbi:MAG TPA: anaerobic sulfatase maturase [Candidatus Paceibacterota bacterium]|nr:anaerobic sulfatase maturase [Candidatus Paceibacterota bacterium]